MSSSELIKTLENFKDNYTTEEFVSFINSIPMLKNFYTERVNKFAKYLCEHEELVKRFVEDLSSKSELYKSEEERNIIKDIEQNRLHLFYMLSCIENGQNLVNTNDKLYMKIAPDFFFEYKENNSKLIDYIRDFCVIFDAYDEDKNNETSAFRKLIKDFTDRQKEMARIIYKTTNCNASRKEIASELGISESGVQTLLEELKNNKNIDGLKDLRSKISYTKNR